MMKLTVLGCGSAILTSRYFCSSQVLDIDGELYMIDCGEATQMQFFGNKLKQSKLHNIFISHLHADHCLGLIGFLSSLALLNRTDAINIFGPKDIEYIIKPFLDYFCHERPFDINFYTIRVDTKSLIYEDCNTKIYAFPLNHRVECYGYLLEEQEKERHIIADCISQYNIPFDKIPLIKQGYDYISTDGSTIPNNLLTTPPDSVKRFAYCSDTTRLDLVLKVIEGVDLLYHETTYLKEEQDLAIETFHSTTTDAAAVAKNAKVKKLLIGHYSNRHTNVDEFLRETKMTFPNVIAAKPNFEIMI